MTGRPSLMRWASVMDEEPTILPVSSRREAEMAAARMAGATLQEIGDIFGVTRERVGQILARAGVPKRLTSPGWKQLPPGRRFGGKRKGAGPVVRARRRMQVAAIKTLWAQLGRRPVLSEIVRACGKEAARMAVSQLTQDWVVFHASHPLRRPHETQIAIRRMYRAAGFRLDRIPIGRPRGQRYPWSELTCYARGLLTWEQVKWIRAHLPLAPDAAPR